MSWDSGVKAFVDILLGYSPRDISQPPVLASRGDVSTNIPSASELVRLAPNDIRRQLAKIDASWFLSDSKEFDYEKYKRFCEEYDSPIFLATRVKAGSDNDNWLDLKVEQEIGHGNFGKVFTASDSSGHRTALKIAHSEVRDNELMLTSFRRGVSSMRILSEDKIPGTACILDASELPPSLTMEFIDGINFESYIFQFDDISYGDRIKVILKIALIVQRCHLHERIIFHRDLRPANIMISGDYWDRVNQGDVYVLDFDLSWYEGASGSEYYMNSTQDLGYLAPEQLDPKSPYSSRSALVDVFGVGMLLYFALCREHPFANACRSSDWPEKCLRVGQRIHLSRFRSSQWRISRLLYNSTNEKQPNRPMLGDFIEELKILVDVIDGNFPNIDLVIFEEICYNINSDYFSSHYGMGATKHKFLTATGIDVLAWLDARTIKLTLRHTTSESVDRKRRPKLLEAAFKRSSEVANTFSTVNPSKSGVGHGTVSIEFGFDIPGSTDSLSKVIARVDQVIRSMQILN